VHDTRFNSDNNPEMEEMEDVEDDSMSKVDATTLQNLMLSILDRGSGLLPHLQEPPLSPPIPQTINPPPPALSQIGTLPCSHPIVD
jgi:hypothetical protein